GHGDRALRLVRRRPLRRQLVRRQLDVADTGRQAHRHQLRRQLLVRQRRARPRRRRRQRSPLRARQPVRPLSRQPDGGGSVGAEPGRGGAGAGRAQLSRARADSRGRPRPARARAVAAVGAAARAGASRIASRGAGERVGRAFRRYHRRRRRPPPRRHMIRFDSVVKTFGAHRAVDGLDLAIGAGEIVALLGPNGSGKTTSLKMAAGLTRPTWGRVLVGDPGRDAATAVARRALSFLPQRVGFPEALSGVEVMEFYRTLRHATVARSRELLAMAALNGAAARPVGTYSGGMVQRLGLAVAAVADAPVLILDEPTASLDPAGLEAFYALVDAQRRAGR